MDWVYLNGNFVRSREATVSVFDRGFLFSDSVYEVIAVLDGKLVDFYGHLERLERSCASIGLQQEEVLKSHSEWKRLFVDVVERNSLREGAVYVQITGGVSPGLSRNFMMDRTISPTIVMFTQEKSIIHNKKAKTGLKVVTLQDTRWTRREIKTTQLLSQLLAKNTAAQAGVDDAWFVTKAKSEQENNSGEGDGMVISEGSSSNAYIITHDGQVITCPTSNSKVLPGITRRAVLQCLQKKGLTLMERHFTVQEAQAAKEAFSTASSTFIMPVVEIDGVTIGNGSPGELTCQLRELYIERVRSEGERDGNDCDAQRHDQP